MSSTQFRFRTPSPYFTWAFTTGLQIERRDFVPNDVFYFATNANGREA